MQPKSIEIEKECFANINNIINAQKNNTNKNEMCQKFLAIK